jgi:chemotaxis protein CheD
MQHEAPSPRPLRGFGGQKRFWDALAKSWVVQILPGEFYVTRAAEIIATTLGSCVSVCIRDRAGHIGGMNHFMLPDDPGPDMMGEATRYGFFAIERLINEIVKHGGSRDTLEVKMFGGGRVIELGADIGRSNIEFTRRYLTTEGLELAAEDVGGGYARRVRYFPLSGRALLKRLTMTEAAKVAVEESDHKAKLVKTSITGAVELFK